MNFHQDFIVAWGWLLNLFKFQNIGWSVFCADNRFHLVILPYLIHYVWPSKAICQFLLPAAAWAAADAGRPDRVLSQRLRSPSKQPVSRLLTVGLGPETLDDEPEWQHQLKEETGDRERREISAEVGVDTEGDKQAARHE